MQSPRRCSVVLVCLLAVPARTVADTNSVSEREMIEAVRLLLLGTPSINMPVTFTSRAPENASPGVEGWTMVAEGSGQGIYIYTQSETFRCAMRGDRQCRLKLASVIVHEAWHITHGPDEAGAYAEQIVFLRLREAAATTIAGVLRARAHVTSTPRKHLQASTR